MHIAYRIAPGALVVALAAAISVGAAAAPTVERAASAPDVQAANAAMTVEAADTPAGISYIVESDYARGKAIVLGAPAAATAAALYTISNSGDAARAQAITFYPVEGTQDAYVLANAEGKVLARNADDSATPRNLNISTLTVEEALADPIAQWKVEQRTGGIVQLSNAKLYTSNGTKPTLDLYDWKTADGSQIQTWDQSANGVQMWRMHVLQAAVQPIAQLLNPGTIPALPANVRGTYGWGAATDLAVTWSMPDPAVWQNDGIVTVEGVATGKFGETVEIPATITVGTIGDAAPSTMNAYVGEGLDRVRLDAPKTVARIVSGSDTTVPANIAWNWDAVPADAFATEGKVTVSAVDGLGFSAELTILVKPAVEKSLLTQPGSRAWRLAANAFTQAALIDGNKDAAATDDWRSGGATNRVATNWIAWYFATPQEVSRLTLAEPTTFDNVGSVTFEYRDMRGGWLPLSAGTIANTGGRLSIDVPVDTVLATAVRATYTQKSTANWMSISEFGAFGPSAAAN